MIELIFWFSAAVVFMVYIGYPLSLDYLSKRFVLGHKIDNGYTPLVTLMIPAYNEEKVIAEKIKNSLSLDYPQDKLEIMILIDESTDKTESIVAGFPDERIKVWIQRPRAGKVSALNKNVSLAKGEIILFSDANSMYHPDAVRKIARHFVDENVGLVCGELKLTGTDTLTGAGEGFYWKYERFLKIKESALGQLLVVNGSIYAIRKELFQSVPTHLADDFVLPMRIAREKFQLVYELEAINEEKTSVSAQDEFNRKVRIIAQGLAAAFSVWPIIFQTSGLRVFEFLMHKFLRWFAFLFLGAVYLSSSILAENKFYCVVFFAQGVFYLAAIIGFFLEEAKIHLKVFFVPFYFCLVNAAAFFALLKLLNGSSQAVWEKAESTR